MPDHKIVEYISEQLAKGFTFEQIRQVLATQGWPEKEISSAYAAATAAPPAPISSPAQQSRPSASRISDKPGIPSSIVILAVIVIIFISVAAGAYIMLPNFLDKGRTADIPSGDKTSVEDGRVPCSLRSPYEGMTELSQGSNAPISISGFVDHADSVTWRTEDTGIVSIDPLTGSSVMVTGLSPGQASIVVTDPAGGIDCSVIIKLNVVPTSSPPPAISPSAILRCGGDMECFKEASGNCNISSLNSTASLSLLGINVTSTTYMEIKGYQQERCTLYLKLERVSIAFPPETDNQTISQQEEIYKKMEGRDGTCQFNTTSGLRAYLGSIGAGDIGANATQGGNVTIHDWREYAECSGPYFQAG